LSVNTSIEARVPCLGKWSELTALDQGTQFVLGGLVSDPFDQLLESLLLFEVIIVIVSADEECHVIPVVVFLHGGGDGVRIPE